MFLASKVGAPFGLHNGNLGIYVKIYKKIKYYY